MKAIEQVLDILNGSINYEFDGTVLKVTSYFTGETVRLDLGNLTQEMLDELQVEDDNEEEWEDEQ